MHKDLCGEAPLTCVFFDAKCLEDSGSSAAKSVGFFMSAITRGFNFDNMLGAFGSAIALFCIARAGGIPVPSTRFGSFLWWVVITIQALEYFLQLFSLLMTFLGYLNMRHQHGACMFQVAGWRVMDMCMLLTWLTIPMVSQGLLVLFIYAYV